MRTIFFVIPVYKVEDYLRRCVDSVINQSYTKTEIVLVDDGSPDSCPAICDEYAAKCDNISVIHKPNGGLSDARNAGIAYVKQICSDDDYITFVDSDDFVHSDFAKEMIELCEKNNCGIAQCNYEKGEADYISSVGGNVHVFVQNSETALLDYRLKSACWPKIYKVSLFENIEFPVGMLNEDEFVIYKLVHNAGSVVFTNKKLYYYYQHGTSIMSSIAKKSKNNPHRYDYLKAYDERIAFFKGLNKPDQVLKTHEKICTDLILRYCEQRHLKKSQRDEDTEKYIPLYRKNFDIMIKRKGMPFKRKMMYIAFYVLPLSGVLMSRIFTLRK